MRAGPGVAVASATVLAIAATLASSGTTEPPEQARGDDGRTVRAVAPTTHPRARETCSTRSEARFPQAFTDRRNLVVGPLVIVGGAYTSAGTVRRFGGDKFPVLVKNGRSVTVAISGDARRHSGLGYGRLPQGQATLGDTRDAVRFRACRRGRPSGSAAGGIGVTFWSGFVLTRAPACVPLEVYTGRRATPRRVGLPLGRRCPG